MDRDLARLATEEFDVIVAGGGVYALATAWELASSGLAVAILERDDFGGATSFNSLKTIHGGIRSLQRGALTDMREFVRERRAFAVMAPHLVQPLPFIVPTYRHPVRNRAMMTAFLALYDRLAADRNRGVDGSLRLPASRTVGRADCLRLNPAVDPAGVTGGAIWYDYQLRAPERFTMALLDAAVRADAAAANYTAVQSIVVTNGVVSGVRAQDALTGSVFDVRGRVVINAAGPWAWDLLDRSGIRPQSLRAPRFSLAMNIVVDRPPLSHAVGGLVEGGRFLFMVPWDRRSIIGTSHDDYSRPPGTPVEVVPERLEALLADARQALPGIALDPGDIRLVHRGLLPAIYLRGTAALLKRSLVHDHRLSGTHGLVTVVGVRYTTARATAHQTATLAWQILGRTGAPHTGVQPLSGEPMSDLASYQQSQTARSALPADVLRRLIGAYGTGYTAITRIMAEHAHLAAPLSSACAITGAEIAHAVRQEMALHLGDALLRRTAAGTAGHPGHEATARAAAIMGHELSWTAARTAQEIAALDAYYPPR
jgi:glycerol-3-phosphate dehydrogenase